MCALSLAQTLCNAAQLGPWLENTVLTASVTGGLGKAAASTSPGASQCPWQLAKGFSALRACSALTPSSLSRHKLIFNLSQKFTHLKHWMGPISWTSLGAEWGPHAGFCDTSVLEVGHYSDRHLKGKIVGNTCFASGFLALSLHLVQLQTSSRGRHQLCHTQMDLQ